MILPLLLSLWSTMEHVFPLLLTWLGAVAAFSPTDTNPINLVVNQATGGFKLDVPNSSLNFNSAEIFFQVSGKLYRTADGSLKKTNIDDGLGKDTLGKYQYKSILWQAGGARVETYYRYYTDVPAVVFGQHFPDGANGTSVGNPDHTCTGFPTIALEGQAGLLAYLSFGGNMFGGASIGAGEWYYQTTGIRSGITGGPLVVFDRNLNTVVLSPFSEFMAASVWHNGTGSGGYGGEVNYGIMGDVENIPPNFDYQTILYYDKGINQALHEWGGALMRQYGKTRARTESDFSSNYIGYWTDNGAYYYYHTESGKNYEDTMVDVMAYTKEAGIPYRYLQLDSWWYYKGVAGGVKTWDARPDVFPSGLRALYEKIGLPIVAHNRYWAKDTTYAKQNGGNYSFIVEKQSTLSIPIDMTFWDDLFTQSAEWGLIVYEQDWLDVEFKGLKATLSSTSLGKQWLMQFGQAASSHDLNIQYCMANPRHALQSVQIPAVTQARVSGDYHPGNEQWRIGIGSIMAHALGVRPFKDTFWSTTNQTGSPYGHATEPYPRLQAAVATLSAGPVGPSDMVKGADVNLIMRSCNAEGLLLKPSRPATAIDLQIAQKAFQLDMGPKGEVWTTYSDIAGLRFGIILAADLQADWNINAVTAGFGEMMLGMAFTWPLTPSMTPFGTATENLLLKQCGKDDFAVWYTSPFLTLQNQTAMIIGETDKWVPVSPQRVKNILMFDSNLELSLAGAPGETVTMSFMVGAKGLVEIKCVLNEAGTATLNLNKEACY
ncbi:Hypp9481 [Branchiostoma lanceolatum]|uniref:Hypp9481 protein n=1 Tax=Branchiostoma lanceolatum TaxID=7740 RepID=A0A8S4MN85_BRALA|nr:Hypp9481 [Branchiostoma lanceolatum]